MLAQVQVLGQGPCVSSSPGPTEAIRFPQVPRAATHPSPKGSPVLLGQVEPPGRLPATMWEDSRPFSPRPTWEAAPCNLVGNFRARERGAPSPHAAGGLFLP